MKANLDLTKVVTTIPFQDNTLTVAIAVFRDGEKMIVGRGIARKSYRDTSDPGLGEAIATGRALTAIEKKLAGKIVRHHFMG